MYRSEVQHGPVPLLPSQQVRHCATSTRDTRTTIRPASCRPLPATDPHPPAPAARCGNGHRPRAAAADAAPSAHWCTGALVQWSAEAADYDDRPRVGQYVMLQVTRRLCRRSSAGTRARSGADSGRRSKTVPDR